MCPQCGTDTDTYSGHGYSLCWCGNTDRDITKMYFKNTEHIVHKEMTEQEIEAYIKRYKLDE